MISLWPDYKITKETKSKLISSHTDGNYKPNGASEEGTMKHWLSFFLRGSFLTKGPGTLSWLQTEHLDGNGSLELGKAVAFSLSSAQHLEWMPGNWRHVWLGWDSTGCVGLGFVNFPASAESWAGATQ